MTIGALASAAVVLLLSRTVVEGQYTADTLLFEENMEKAEEDLTASLKGGDYVEDVFFPERQVSELNVFGRVAYIFNNASIRLDSVR